MAFRGKRHEGAHEINDPTVNHGNFIEIVKLVAESDAVLKEHINNAEIASKKAVEKRKKGRPDDKPGKHGRGSLVTFLSGDSAKKIMRTFKDFIQETIISEVKEAGIFSLEVDTTQDIIAHDQCAIIIRYVHNGEVHERLLSVIKATSSTGKALFDLVKGLIDKHGLDIRDCVGDSFDDAANMSGKYNGLTAKISEVANVHVHTWCYSQSLNLMISDATSV